MIDYMNDDVNRSNRCAPSVGSTFVLIHGAWHGGWCYARVRRALQRSGHDVFTPTLTGLGDRSHLLDEAVNLTTHARDIVNLVRWENLDNIILVAHSYGSWVASAALEQIAPKVSTVVFLDCYLPHDGERLIDHGRAGSAEDASIAMREKRAGRPAPTASEFGVVDPTDRVWVDSLTTPQPVGTSFEAIRLTGARERVARKIYVRAPAYESRRFDRTWNELANTPGWEVQVMPGGHDVMIDEPELLLQLLLSLTTAVSKSDGSGAHPVPGSDEETQRAARGELPKAPHSL